MDASGRALRAGGTPWLFVMAAILAAAAQLLSGYLYLVSGLVAPAWASASLLVVWVMLTVLGVRLALRRSYWMLVVPVVAVVTWVGVMWVGGAVLGWTAQAVPGTGG